MDQRGGSEGKSGSNQDLDIRSRSWVHTQVSRRPTASCTDLLVSPLVSVFVSLLLWGAVALPQLLFVSVFLLRELLVFTGSHKQRSSVWVQMKGHSTNVKKKKERWKNRKSFPRSTRCCHLKQQRETIGCDTPTSCHLQLFEMCSTRRSHHWWSADVIHRSSRLLI